MNPMQKQFPLNCGASKANSNSNMKFRPIILGVILSCGVASAQTPLLQYTFDEANSGSDPALDSGSGSAANGTFNGGATRTANTPGGFSLGALDLTTTGAGTHLTGGDADKLDGLTSFTLTTWVNLQAVPTGNLRLIAKQAATTFAGFNLNIADPATGTRAANNFGLRLFVGGTTAFAFDAANNGITIDADNKWAFVAVTYDGTSTSGNVNYYSGTETGPVGFQVNTTVNAGPTVASSAIFGVGYTDAAPGSDTSPTGYLDDVRVYGSVLTPVQLEAIRLQAIPEPSACALLGSGVLGLLALRRMKKS
jgi:hypothetical protein